MFGKRYAVELSGEERMRPLGTHDLIIDIIIEARALFLIEIPA